MRLRQPIIQNIETHTSQQICRRSNNPYPNVTSLADRALTVYREDGTLVLVKKALQKLYTNTYCRIISFRGHYSLTLNDETVEFSAPTPTMVKRNRKRFISEQEELRAFHDEIEPEDTVYDIGANTGLYSLFAATKCRRGTVAAFEPYPPNIEVLRQDRDRNALHNIDIVESALSDTVGEIEFSQPDEDDVGYGSSAIDATGDGSSITVPTTTGDKLVADGELPPPNVVKIDVEGAESLVIEGIKQALTTPECRTVFCEVHLPGIDIRPSVEDFGSSLDNIRSKLEAFGFSTRKITTEGESEVTIMATK